MIFISVFVLLLQSPYLLNKYSLKRYEEMLLLLNYCEGASVYFAASDVVRGICKIKVS